MLHARGGGSSASTAGAAVAGAQATRRRPSALAGRRSARGEERELLLQENEIGDAGAAAVRMLAGAIRTRERGAGGERPAVRALNLCENKVGDAGGATLIAAAHAATDLCVESSRAPLNATLSSALAARRDAQRSGALRVEL